MTHERTCTDWVWAGGLLQQRDTERSRCAGADYKPSHSRVIPLPTGPAARMSLSAIPSLRKPGSGPLRSALTSSLLGLKNVRLTGLRTS